MSKIQMFCVVAFATDALITHVTEQLTALVKLRGTPKQDSRRSQMPGP